MNIDSKLIRYISDNWDDERKSQEVQDMIEAMSVELKKDYREYSRKHRMTDEDNAHWEGLLLDLSNRSFWDKMDHILHFSFDF